MTGMNNHTSSSKKEQLLEGSLRVSREQHQTQSREAGRSRRRSRSRSLSRSRHTRYKRDHRNSTTRDSPKHKGTVLQHTDPRGNDPSRRMTLKASTRGTGRNSQSFDPSSTLVRPDVRIRMASKDVQVYAPTPPLTHDDVVLIPELFGKEDDWTVYYTLLEEMHAWQQKQTDQNKHESAEWISWHEGAHLITKNPKGCPTYERILDRLCQYFDMDRTHIGTRFNWYKDSLDWKPFHHDSAAFNEARAKTQNITVGVSFGAMRELAFCHAEEPHEIDISHSRNAPTRNKEAGGKESNACRLYFPQTNNGVLSFGRDVNIRWKHGINALQKDEPEPHGHTDINKQGRISIIVWGNAKRVKEEDGSPALLGSDGKGPHASRMDSHPRDRNGQGRNFNYDEGRNRWRGSRIDRFDGPPREPDGRGYGHDRHDVYRYSHDGLQEPDRHGYGYDRNDVHGIDGHGHPCHGPREPDHRVYEHNQHDIHEHSRKPDDRGYEHDGSDVHGHDVYRHPRDGPQEPDRCGYRHDQCDVHENPRDGPQEPDRRGYRHDKGDRHGHLREDLQKSDRRSYRHNQGDVHEDPRDGHREPDRRGYRYGNGHLRDPCYHEKRIGDRFDKI